MLEVRWRFDFLLQASIVPFDFSKAAARCRDVSGGNPATDTIALRISRDRSTPNLERKLGLK